MGFICLNEFTYPNTCDQTGQYTGGSSAAQLLLQLFCLFHCKLFVKLYCALNQVISIFSIWDISETVPVSKELPLTWCSLCLLVTYYLIVLSSQQAREAVEQGHRMDPPEGTPKEVYDDAMWPCWYYEPEERPTFSELVTKLKGIISKMSKK